MASLPIAAFEPRQSNFQPAPTHAIVGTTTAPAARLTALEWSIVAMAERDGISSIREAGRYTKALRNFFGFRQPNRLANDRLEILRRVAIFAWHYGWNVPKSELTAFFQAGFSSDQFELIQLSLGQTRAERRRRPAR
jgi:hypothetical protein